MYLDVTISVYLYLLSYFVSCICCLAYWQYDKQCVPRSKIISLFLLFTTVLPYALLCANRSEYTGYDTENYMIGYWNMKYGMGEITNSGFNYFFRIARYVTYIVTITIGKIADSLFPTVFLLLRRRNMINIKQLS